MRRGCRGCGVASLAQQPGGSSNRGGQPVRQHVDAVVAQQLRQCQELVPGDRTGPDGEGDHPRRGEDLCDEQRLVRPSRCQLSRGVATTCSSTSVRTRLRTRLRSSTPTSTRCSLPEPRGSGAASQLERDFRRHEVVLARGVGLGELDHRVTTSAGSIWPGGHDRRSS